MHGESEANPAQKDWNPVTAEEVNDDPSVGYRASKTFAERAAWDFVEKEKPNFSVSTVILRI